MADNAMKQRVHDELKRAYFKDVDDLVDVSDGKEKNDLIWSVLTQNLPPDVWGRISLSVGTSPEEIKAT